MKTIYLECAMGAAGDMLCAALYELCENKDQVINELNNIGLTDILYTAVPSVKRGVGGTKFNVSFKGHQEGNESENPVADSARNLEEVMQVIENLSIPESVIKNAKEIYKIIADAESTVHGVSVGEVHFHEVGAMDAIADIVAFCYLIDLIKPEKIIASPVATGYGHVKCAHGLLPVPAPATALINYARPQERHCLNISYPNSLQCLLWL
jgi:hypothetical protein